MDNTKQRGSGWSIKLVFNLYKLFGYNFIYYLMYPVTFFYYLFAKNVRESLEIYYKHLGIKLTNKIYYEHLRIFAITMVDRFITKVDKKAYIYEYDDIETPLQVFSNATVLIQSHFGGWASSTNVSRSENRINIVMKEAVLDSIKNIEDSIQTKSNISIIDLNQGALITSIQIANALMANEVVAMMGDRASNPKSTIECEFLGELATFNKNPFEIAYKVNKPIMLYFIIYLDKQRYKIEFIKIDMEKKLNEKDSIQKALKIYVLEYERLVKKYPNQWFNFYDFWMKDSKNK